MIRGFRRLFTNQDGSTAIEYALVFMIMLLVTLGTIEIGLVMWQWNAAEKATQAGLRKAVVSDLVAPGLAAIGTTPVSTQYGDWCTDREDGSANPDCQFETVTCVQGSCNGFGYDGTAFTAIYDSMRSMYPMIEPQNVHITYAYSGLGFVGRPGGQPMLVTVRLINMTYDFFILDVLTDLPDLIPMPAFAATMIGEDMSNSL